MRRVRTRGPTLGQVAVAVAFAFSCFALLIFLWTTFGGPVPLKPEGYRIKVPFDEGTQLAVESDVRISNVSVGKVKAIDLANSGPDKDLGV
ncbi:MAG TPA: MlaD family protein, partial [Solirubrobacterales bacterium]